MSFKLHDYQLAAVNQLKNGSILCGDVGSGKSLTALGYYYLQQCGDVNFLNGKRYVKMKNPKDLYIITTAKKRDSLEWEGELGHFFISVHDDINIYNNKIIIDSWNNIKKYDDITNAFFIFDEQRVVGSGAWVKAFLKITKHNEWILLSATPGDTWQDYIPVFIANGFYKNKTEFSREHIVYSRFSKYPKIDRYVNTGRLIRLRNSILVDMVDKRSTIPHHEYINTDYDRFMYKWVTRNRKNPFDGGYIPCCTDDPEAQKIGTDISIKDVSPILSDWDYEPENGDYVKYEYKPFKSAGDFCYTLRKVVNSDPSRGKTVLEILEKTPRAIIFYNFDYELDILKHLSYHNNVEIAEWNGHKHQPIPDSSNWVYLVQYNAGCEGWNCIKTDTIIFFSQNYSYKVIHQASGRINRMNTPFTDLYYYHLKSNSGIDTAIYKALNDKKKFNEQKFVGARF